jgi:hypothetical protein
MTHKYSFRTFDPLLHDAPASVVGCAARTARCFSSNPYRDDIGQEAQEGPSGWGVRERCCAHRRGALTIESLLRLESRKNAPDGSRVEAGPLRDVSGPVVLDRVAGPQDF